MAKVLASLKHKQKGQGIVEYALLLAFVVGIAMMLNGANLGGAVKDTFDKVAAILNGGDNTYATAFQKWRKTPRSQLMNEDINPNSERVKADQEALILFAKAFIGLPPDKVLAKLKEFTNGNSTKNGSVNIQNNAQTGYSQGILVPFMYNDNGSLDYNDDGTLANANGYISFNNQTNIGAANFLSADVNTTVTNGQARTTDRLFYSNDMIGGTGGTNDRMIAARLHYTDGVVDSVDIAAYKGTALNNTNTTTVVQDLNLHVTETSHTVNTLDYVRNPNLQRQ